MVLVEPDTSVVSESGRLRVEIGREQAATKASLDPSPSWGDCQRDGAAERQELCRQLESLRQHVARAQSRKQDAWALRAELATLLSFAKTLRSDAQVWRAAREEAVHELERREEAARQEWERTAAERRELVRRRDALQLSIDETASGLVQAHGGECRNTVPVFAFGEGITVCSVSVDSPRRSFRLSKRWLVTFNASRDDALVRRS